MEDIFDKLWGNPVVTGDEKAKKPGLVAFGNSELGMEMLYKHINNRSRIAIHCDVDVDGIGTGYIMGRFLRTQTPIQPLYIINKDKVHGIQQKHADYFGINPVDLLIIVDSSSNELDIIKQFNCDVLVIDHHEVSHNEMAGLTNDGKHRFIIINNTVDNLDINSIKCFVSKFNTDTAGKLESYVADDRMSCGLVVYELLRLYSDTFKLGPILENLRLFQWVGVTLFTDAILLNTDRNQWYIENTVHSSETEMTLKTLLGELNHFKSSLDKSLINYTIAPVINKAIRAGASGEALNTVIFNPKSINDITKYKIMQEDAISTGVENSKICGSYIMRDLSNTNIHKNYNGVIASRLSGDNNKNAVVYSVHDGIAEGSFRGRVSHVDYRKFFDEYSENTLAQGHKAAFGFKCPIEILDEIMEKLVSIESNVSDRYTLTAGRLNNESPGTYQIDDMEQFKKQGGMWRLGIGNSKLSSEEQVMITVSSADAKLIEQRGKLYLYNVLGLTCKAFEVINKPIINIYVEYSNQIDCYIK